MFLQNHENQNRSDVMFIHSRRGMSQSTCGVKLFTVSKQDVAIEQCFYSNLLTRPSNSFTQLCTTLPFLPFASRASRKAFSTLPSP
jgi:hypothetical protein